MFSENSISRKLARMNMLVSGVALLLACGAFIAYDVIAIRDSMVYNLSMQAQIVGFNSISAVLFNDTKSAEKTLSALMTWPNIVSAGIYTMDGRPFATYRRAGAGQGRVPPSIPQEKWRHTISIGVRLFWLAGSCFKASPPESLVSDRIWRDCRFGWRNI